jgi:hypothetical protein
MIIYLAPQKSPLPLETMSQFTEPVIPDERRFAGRDPESSRKFNIIIKVSLDPGSHPS